METLNILSLNRWNELRLTVPVSGHWCHAHKKTGTHISCIVLVWHSKCLYLWPWLLIELKHSSKLTRANRRQFYSSTNRDASGSIFYEIWPESEPDSNCCSALHIDDDMCMKSSNLRINCSVLMSVIWCVLLLLLHIVIHHIMLVWVSVSAYKWFGTKQISTFTI